LLISFFNFPVGIKSFFLSRWLAVFFMKRVD
jgi:hypothetical protein